MKKLIAHILIVTIFTLGIGGALAVPQTAHAACSIGGVVTTGNGLTDCVNELVVVAVMPIVGKFLQLSAYLFDHAITLNLNIAQFLQNCIDKDCKTSPVEVVWKLIRDISGMFFIFVLVWASILMILRGESSKSTIIGVIMAGLLVNFSLFATKVIIDGSNSLTLTVYSAISPNYNPTLAASVGFGAQDVNKQIPGSVSSKIMQVVDIQSLYASTKDATKKTNFNVSSIVSTVGGISLMLVLGIAFLAAGLMFLWRFVMLLVLMAFSPIPALAYAFPGLRGQSTKFMKVLMDQCLFAPVFLFFLYIALKVLTDPAFLALSNPNHSTFAGVFGGGGIAPLIQYGLVIFIIFMGLVTAKSFGVKGADFGINGINWLSKMGQGALRTATLGTATVITRNTAGNLAAKIGDSQALQDAASKSTIAALGLKGFKTAGASYKQNVEKKAEARVKFAESLGYNKNTAAVFQDKIFENERLLDGFKKSMANPDLTDEGRAQLKINIEMKEKENKEFKKKIAEEKLRRQQNVARRDDPRIDLATGERGKMSLGQRINRFGFISSEDEDSSSQLSVKSLEDALKEQTESRDKMDKKREEIKREIDRREKEITVDFKNETDSAIRKKKIEKARKEDDHLNKKKKELYDVVAGEERDGVRQGGIIEAEAKIRKLKNNIAKLK